MMIQGHANHKAARRDLPSRGHIVTELSAIVRRASKRVPLHGSFGGLATGVRALPSAAKAAGDVAAREGFVIPRRVLTKRQAARNFYLAWAGADLRRRLLSTCRRASLLFKMLSQIALKGSGPPR